MLFVFLQLSVHPGQSEPHFPAQHGFQEQNVDPVRLENGERKIRSEDAAHRNFRVATGYLPFPQDLQYIFSISTPF